MPRSLFVPISIPTDVILHSQLWSYTTFFQGPLDKFRSWPWTSVCLWNRPQGYQFAYGLSIHREQKRFGENHVGWKLTSPKLGLSLRSGLLCPLIWHGYCHVGLGLSLQSWHLIISTVGRGSRNENFLTKLIEKSVITFVNIWISKNLKFCAFLRRLGLDWNEVECKKNVQGAKKGYRLCITSLGSTACLFNQLSLIARLSICLSGSSLVFVSWLSTT